MENEIAASNGDTLFKMETAFSVDVTDILQIIKALQNTSVASELRHTAKHRNVRRTRAYEQAPLYYHRYT